MAKFRELPEVIHKEVPSLKLTMFGGVGVGKSSFLNTVATALENDVKERVRKDHGTAPSRTGKSKTKKVV